MAHEIDINEIRVAAVVAQRSIEDTFSTTGETVQILKQTLRVSDQAGMEMVTDYRHIKPDVNPEWVVGRNVCNLKHLL